MSDLDFSCMSDLQHILSCGFALDFTQKFQCEAGE